MPFTDQPGAKTVQSGDVVSYEAKNPITTWRGWGGVVSGVSSLLLILQVSGVITADQSTALNSNFVPVATAAGVVVGALMQLYGGWKARRPLGFTGTMTDPKAVN